MNCNSCLLLSVTNSEFHFVGIGDKLLRYFENDLSVRPSSLEIFQYGKFFVLECFHCLLRFLFRIAFKSFHGFQKFHIGSPLQAKQIFGSGMKVSGK